MTKSILFIGAGRMAEAIIAGLQEHHIFDEVYISNRHSSERLVYLSEKYAVKKLCHWNEKIKQVDLIVLAMPPEEHPTVLKQMKPFLSHQFVVTIAAGIGPSILEAELPNGIPVAWMMPNTAAEVGHSITLYTYGTYVNETNKSDMKILVNSIGKAMECTETDIHQLTAVTGSSPAFIYLTVEALVETTEKLGFSKDKSRHLVTEMIIGSIEMLKTGLLPNQLREQVTTPGGATAAGINVLENGGLKQLIEEAVKATNKKAKGDKEKS